MPKDDSDGLLSRVAKLVRPGSVAQGETEPPELSREAVRQMLERRRRNDLVRQREFAALRKMRRASVVLAVQDQTDLMPPTAPTDTRVPTDLQAPDSRLHTLRRIEQIEHEMSTQWPQLPSRPSRPAGLPPTRPGATVAGAATQPAAMDTMVMPVPSALRSEAERPRARVILRPAEYPTTTDESPAEMLLTQAGLGSRFQTGLEGSTAEMALDAAFPRGLGDGPLPTHLLPDPKIESASILFAGGDTAAAQASLTTVLASGVGHEETWRALLDLYRATGQRQSFEALAAQLRAHFQPPPWRDLRAGASTPEPVREGVLQLSGRLTGSIADLLKSFDQQSRDLRRIDVSCAWLERIDFVAAGSLLNWAIAQQAAQRQLCFVDTHRLVAGFLKVVGLAAHADIQVRAD